ncbi:proline-rich transmembrane 1-like [Paramuricea clavata]|uniref:Proline-rich transmembrane 1-like n=1 Tax=Paramuricea clavata TaxID=317549 RepID=A0A7D9LT13_PARCT|nr:proline-rich transmembrane 1-like [Paramuricea clavata]
MASEGAPPPPYNTSYQPNAPPQYPPYPNQPPYPPSAPPSYSATQDQPKAYPVQPGAAPYPQQGIPPGYGQPGYPIQGAAAGYTTQAVGVAYHPHAQTTIITQQPTHGAVIIHNTAPPPDYMVVSIISMFCCFCIGIFAMLKSIRSRELYRAGDHAGAQEMGLRAKKLANVGIFVAICIYVSIVLLRIILSLVLSN